MENEPLKLRVETPEQDADETEAEEGLYKRQDDPEDAVYSEDEEDEKSARLWRRVILLLGCVVVIFTLAGHPPVRPLARPQQQVSPEWQAEHAFDTHGPEAAEVQDGVTRPGDSKLAARMAKLRSRKIKVCVRMKAPNPRHASTFVRNFFQQFGGRLEYVVRPRVWHEVEAEHTTGSLPRGDLPAKPVPCKAKWPVVYLTRKGNTLADVPRNYTRIMVGDEHCLCDERCEDKSVVQMRHYFSSKMASGGGWLPLGPRFEFLPVPQHEREKDPLARRVPFNFVGTNTNPHRAQLKAILANAENVLQHPLLSKGFVRILDEWTRDPGAHGGLKPMEYRSLLMDSTFTLAVRGVNYETFRMYEAIEAGSIPVIEVGYDYHHAGGCKRAFRRLLHSNPPFIMLKSWSEFPQRLEEELANPERLRQRHRELLVWRESFWTNVTRELECTVIKHHIETSGDSSPILRTLDC